MLYSAVVRSASGLPADILRLPKRGYLKAGHFADIVVFDPTTFRDVATYINSGNVMLDSKKSASAIPETRCTIAIQ